MQRVARKLQEIATSAYITVRDDKAALPAAARRLGAVYAPEAVSPVAQDLASQAATGFRNFEPLPPLTVQRLVKAGTRCIAATASAGPKFSALYVTLVRLDAANDPGHLNPTPWALRGFALQQSTPKEQLCAPA